MFHLIWVGGSYPSWVAQVMLLYLGISEKHIKSTSRVPRILVPDLGRPTKFKTPGPKVMFLYLGSSKSSKSSKHRAPTVMFLYLESSKSSKSSKPRVPTAMFLYLGRSKNTKKTKCSGFFRSWFFQGLSLACLVGLLLFMEWDFFSRASHLLVVSSCLFFGEGGFFQGLSLACLVGLLLFLKWDFFHGASSLLVVSSCHIFW